MYLQKFWCVIKQDAYRSVTWESKNAWFSFSNSVLFLTHEDSLEVFYDECFMFVVCRLQICRAVIWWENIHNLWNGRFFISRDSTRKWPWFFCWLVIMIIISFSFSKVNSSGLFLQIWTLKFLQYNSLVGIITFILLSPLVLIDILSVHI